MVRDAEKLELATYYRKRGFTYSEIAKICGVSKATISAWLSKKAFSKKVKAENVSKAARSSSERLRLINKARAKERDKAFKSAVADAKVSYKHYRNDPLFMAGLMLYVGSGDKKNKQLIRISGAHIDTHRVFIKFMVQYLGIDIASVRFWILLYPDLVEAECVRIWSKSLKLKPEQFYKNQVLKTERSDQTLRNGVGHTIIGDTVLKIKLMTWIELALKDL